MRAALLRVLQRIVARRDRRIAAAAAPATSSPSVDELLAQGNRLEDAGHPAEALEIYQQAGIRAPASARVLLNLGNGFRALGRHAEAVEAYRKASALEPGNSAPLLNLGNALVAGGEFAEAVLAYRRAIALRPDWIDAWIGLSCAYDGDGRTKDALDAAHHAVFALDAAHEGAMTHLSDLLAKEAGASTLMPHPQSKCDAVRGISFRMAPLGTRLWVRFVLEGDLDRLLIQPIKAPARGEDLWKHLCFEVFIAGKGNESYREFNLSPSREWTILDFASYRNATGAQVSGSAVVQVWREGSLLQVDALLPLGLEEAVPFRVGASAVVEAIDGSLSYWALKHVADSPDFHRAESFTLETELVG